MEARRYWLVCIGDAEEFQLLEAVSRLWVMGCLVGAKNVLMDAKVTLTIRAARFEMIREPTWRCRPP